MTYKISTTHQFEKDLKRCIKRGYPMDKFRTVIQLLEKMDVCQRFITLTYSTVIVKVNGNAIYYRTGS